MSTLSRWWNRWVDAWSAREHGRSLAWFRMAMGLLVFLDTLSLVIAGVVDPLYRPLAEGGLAPATKFFHPVLAALGASMELSWATITACLVLSVLVGVGLGGRVVAFLLLQAVLLLHALPDDVGGGYDRLVTNGLFLLVVGDATATHSLDCWLRTGRWTTDRPIAALARYLGIFQLVVVYTATGFGKHGEGWFYPWDAVFHALQRLPYVRSESLAWLGYAYPLTRVGTVVAWWWEALFPLAGLWWVGHLGWAGPIWKRRCDRIDLRWPFLGLGLVTHGVLTATLNVGTFGAVTLIFYLLWLDPPGSSPASGGEHAVVGGEVGEEAVADVGHGAPLDAVALRERLPPGGDLGGAGEQVQVGA